MKIFMRFLNSFLRSSAWILVFAIAFSLFSSCRRTTQWESVCQVIRRDVVERDEKGVAQVVEFELEWDPCPGDQLQVLRGDAAFATCTEKYAVGDYVPVRVKRWWDTRGYYRWDIYQIGDCARAIEEQVEGSFEKSQECDETKAQGRINGFACTKKPFAKLVSICPWIARQ